MEDALRSVRARFTLDLHPSRMADVGAGISDQLDAQLLRFSEDLGGVPLAYSAVRRVPAAAATVSAYYAYVRVAVEATALVFRPRVGARLAGRVIKVGSDYIGLLVLGVFNAAIPRDAIRREFAPDAAAPAEEPRWVSRKHPGHAIGLGDDVRFELSGVSDAGGFFSLAGALEAADTGEARFLESRGVSTSGKAAAAASGKKQKRAEREAAADGDADADAHGTPAKRAKEGSRGDKSHKKEKHRSGDGGGSGKKQKGGAG
jgi:DNA-directed RNA polymerase I subunit RPA43